MKTQGQGPGGDEGTGLERLFPLLAVLDRCDPEGPSRLSDEAWARDVRGLLSGRSTPAPSGPPLTTADLRRCVTSSPRVSAYWGIAEREVLAIPRESWEAIDRSELARLYEETAPGNEAVRIHDHLSCADVLAGGTEPGLALARARHLDRAAWLGEALLGRPGPEPSWDGRRQSALVVETAGAYAAAARATPDRAARADALLRARALLVGSDARAELASIEAELGEALTTLSEPVAAERMLRSSLIRLQGLPEASEERTLAVQLSLARLLALTRWDPSRALPIARQVAQAASGRLRAEALALQSRCLAMEFRLDEAERTARDVIAAARGLADDPALLASAHHDLGLILRGRREPAAWEEAIGHLEQSLALAPADAARRAEALGILGRVLAQTGRYDEARRALDESLAACRANDDALGEGAAHGGLGELWSRHGHPERAVPEYEANLSILRERVRPPNLRLIAQNLGLLAHAHVARGDVRRAKEALDEAHGAIAQMDEAQAAIAQPYHQWTEAVVTLAEVATGRKDASALDRVCRLCRESIAGFTRQVYPRALPNVCITLAEALRLAGQAEEALQTLQEEAARPWDSFERTYWCRELGLAWKARGDEERGTNYLAKGLRWARSLDNRHALALYDALPSRVSELAGLRIEVEGGGALLPPGGEGALRVLVLDFEGRPCPGMPISIEAVPKGVVGIEAAPRTDARGAIQATLRAGPRDGVATVRVSDPGGALEASFPIEVSSLEIAGIGELAPPLASEEAVILRRLYARDCASVEVLAQFGGGFGGSRVILVRPVTRHAGPGAPNVVKVGPRPLVVEEMRAYERLVGRFITVRAARATDLAEFGGRAGIVYLLAGADPGAAAKDLEKWLRVDRPDLARVRLLLSTLFEDTLGPAWYRNHTVEDGSLMRELAPVLPPGIELDCRGPGAGVFPAGGLPPAPPPGLATIADGLRHGAPLPTEARVEGLSVKEVEASEEGVKVELRDAEGHRVVARLAAGTTVPSPAPLTAIGRVVRTGVSVLVKRAGQVASRAGIALPGGADGLVRRWSEVLDLKRGRRRSIIHGDLHLRNVLVDRDARPWLIDFGLTRQGYTLFDFVKLECYFVLFALGRNPAVSTEAFQAWTGGMEDDAGETPPRGLSPDLELGLGLVREVRRHAAHYLSDPGDPREYAEALLCYALSLLRYFGRADEGEETERQGRFILLHALACLGRLDRAADPR